MKFTFEISFENSQENYTVIRINQILIMKYHKITNNTENKARWAVNASTRGHSKTLLSKTVLPSECKHSFYNTIQSQLRQISIYGFTKAHYTLNTNQINQLSLFFDPNEPTHISICFNNMKYEVIIPSEEICRVETINFGKLVLTFRYHFERKYYYREIDHPWLLKRILLYNDPTDGYFDEAKQQIGMFHKFRQTSQAIVGRKDGACSQVIKQSNGTSIMVPSELILTEKNEPFFIRLMGHSISSDRSFREDSIIKDGKKHGLEIAADVGIN
ncbi:15188_t:CDS:2 [Cetraspora pellucida]|uniref:15188_t:CDS:1 n=1 Tax=Cetraspora pellucida TaxID=1433469 RepID=A0ACA9KLB7_9GLOM|nr:15188_t:CDS:2 [Cetraspora pellucida]